MLLAVDGEFDSLDPTVCTALCWVDIDTGDEHDCGLEIESGLRFLMGDHTLVFHNGVAFDLPALRKLYPWFQPRNPIVDTLVLSRLAYPDLSERDLAKWSVQEMRELDHRARPGSHALNTWGVRLGLNKGEYSGEWTDGYNAELAEYCLNDCRVTARLYKKVAQLGISEDADKLEHEFAEVCVAMQTHGFAFDDHKARLLYETLLRAVDDIEGEMLETFGSWYEADGPLVVPKRSMAYKNKPHVTEGCAYQKVKLVHFNPNSRAHIAKVLQAQGWKPSVMTESGKLPRVDESILNSISDQFPAAKLLARSFMLTKRLGLVRSWIEHSRNGRIHARVISNSARTGRTSSVAPNMQQIPNLGSEYGKECRELFTASAGRKLLAADLDKAELMVLAHYMHPYDKGAYAKILAEGDAHQTNADAMGISRDRAKGVVFAMIYGSGDERLGRMAGADGKTVRKRLLAALPALDALIKKARKVAKKVKQLRSLDGRVIPIDSDHKALNYLIQSATSCLAKDWAVRATQLTAHLDCNLVLYVHDELQFDCAEEHLVEASHAITQALREANDFFSVRAPLTCDVKVGDNWSESH